MTTMTAPAPDHRAPRPSGPAPGEPLRFAGLRVGVVGLGVEGIDIVRFLHREGAAEIVVSERKPIDALREPIRALGGIPIAIEAGANDPGLAGRVDALFVSQGVPDDLPLLAAARDRGVPITAMMRLFLRRCPAPVIGITGSAGKTTVTSLVGAMFEASGRPAFVGGNIGRGLLSALDDIGPETTAVLEISHTQLARTDRSPRLAAVLNVTPNHLDQFGWGDYVDLKRNLVRWQRPGDLAVLPRDEPVAAGFAADTPATVHRFGTGPFAGPGATIANGRIVWRDGAAEHDVGPAAAIRLPGAHNLDNVLAAVAIGGAWGLPPAAMADAIRGFTGVPHRLETVAEVGGVRYVDDSIATTPERAVAALRALEGPIVLLLGGREKRLPLSPLAEAARGRLRAAVGFGEAGAAFTEALRAAGAAPSVAAYEGLADAVAAARAIARPGDTVLLSPAGTSFDAYPNFAARGDHFRSLALGEEAADGAG
jgi:UDP-N-acetylmuramoylalanine--D-glutamate ligase